MTQAQSIGGAVDNGRVGVAIFRSVYEGPVGIRDRDGGMEIAFFSPPMRYRLPIDGMVDGQRVRMTAVRARDFDPDRPIPARSSDLRAIVATVIPLSEG